MPAEEIDMIDTFDASDDRLRLAVARAVHEYGEDELFDCIADPDPIIRTTAARALHVHGSRAVFDRVLPLTRHPRHDMREVAVFVLAQLGTPKRPYADQTFPALLPLLNDPYWEVRRAAAQAVGCLSWVVPIPADIRDRLLALATDEAADVRTAVAAALGSVDDPRTTACLLRLADDDDPVVRDDAESSLEDIAERESRAGAAEAAE